MSYSRWELVDGHALNEPGISTIDNGQWSRTIARCTTCGETRKVWVGLTMEQLAKSAGHLSGVDRLFLGHIPRRR